MTEHQEPPPRGGPEDHDLVTGCMAAGEPKLDAGEDLGVAIDELDQPRVRNGYEVLGKVGRLRPRIAVEREIPFAPLHKMLRAGKGDLNPAALRAARVPARVVPV